MKEQKLNLDFDTNPPVSPSEYDQAVQMSIPGYEALHTMALSFLRARLPETADLLIVGAGSGMELVKFGKANSNWNLIGVDPSVNMLAIAQQKIEQHGLSDRVKLFQGYTHDLPTTPLYDGATCILVMHFLPDDGSKLAFLQSIFQRLKSSAALILVDLFGKKGTEAFEQLAYVWKLYSQEMGMTSQMIEMREKATQEGVYPIPELRVLELLQQVGFGNIIRFYTGLCFGGWIATKSDSN
jgi:tRNA (cmo5U34)-methyltransferase